MKVKLRCRDCGKAFIVDDEVPLPSQVGWLHVWNDPENEKKSGCELKHREFGDESVYDW